MLKELDVQVMEETAGGTCFNLCGGSIFEPGQLVIDAFHALDNYVLYPVLGAVLTPIKTITTISSLIPGLPGCTTQPTTPSCPTQPTTPTCPTKPTTPTIPSFGR